MKKPFEEIGNYKRYNLIKIVGGGIVLSDDNGWLDCVFDTEKTAKYFIDSKEKFNDNFYNVISNLQERAIEVNNGYVTMNMIKELTIIKPQYLVRPSDFSIFELDESNECYRLWSRKPITYNNGTRPNAQVHFTFENLTKNYDFFPIEESEIETYEKKSSDYYSFLSWQSRSDGHGGSKGGTQAEYLKYLERINKHNENK